MPLKAPLSPAFACPLAGCLVGLPLPGPWLVAWLGCLWLGLACVASSPSPLKETLCRQLAFLAIYSTCANFYRVPHTTRFKIGLIYKSLEKINIKCTKSIGSWVKRCTKCVFAPGWLPLAGCMVGRLAIQPIEKAPLPAARFCHYFWYLRHGRLRHSMRIRPFSTGCCVKRDTKLGSSR